ASTVPGACHPPGCPPAPSSQRRTPRPAPRPPRPPAPPADLPQPPRNPAGFALPRAVSSRAPGSHRGRMGRIRQQAEGALLSADHNRTAQAAAGDAQLEPDGRHHGRHPGHDAGGSMNIVASLRSWMRGSFRRSGVEQQMDDELRFHIESCTDDLVRAGLAPEEARQRACREFGGVEVQKEECRDALGLRLLDELVADGRYACRQLRRSPGFTAVAVLSLALGIGATSAIFSLMEAAVCKPIAVPEPERLGLFSWASGPRSLLNSSPGSPSRT